MVSFVGVGCGDDNNPVQQDAGQHDVNVQDDVIPAQDDVIPAQTDAQHDAGPLYSATIAVYDTELAGPLAGLGQGIAVSITFEDDYAAKAPTLEEQPGQPTGCKLWEYTPAEYAASDGSDEGTVQLTFTQTDMTNGIPGKIAPPCVFQAGEGYICPWGQGLGGTWSNSGVAGTKLFTATNAGPAIGAAANGAWLQVFDAGGGVVVAAQLPIVQIPADNMFVVATLGAAIPDIAETGAWVVVFGQGPSPAFTAEPGAVSDDQTVTVAFTPGTGAHMAAFSETVTPNVGDHFTLKATDNTTTPPTKAITDLPFDGSAFKLECDECNSALGSIVAIVGTDGDTTGLSPKDMPVGTKFVEIRCSYFGVGSVTIPAAYSAYLTDMTRIQTYFMRVVPKLVPQVNIVAGHAKAGWSDAP